MNPTEHNSKIRSAQAGLLTVLVGLVPAAGTRAPSVPRLRRAVLALSLLCASLLALTAASASAIPPSTFCTVGSAAGHCSRPSAVAVDNSTGSAGSGDVFLSDEANQRIDVFDSAGHFLRAFGWSVLNGAPELQVCTTACEPGIPGSGAGQFNSPRGLAVDPASHDIYVSDLGNHRVEKFSPSGEFLFMFGSEVNKTAVQESRPQAEQDVCPAPGHPGDSCGAGVSGSGPGAITRASAIALDPAHHLWVAEAEHERLEQFGSGGEFLSEVKLPGAGEINSLAIDTDASSPSFGDFYTLKPAISSANEVQQVTPPSSGEYALTFGGQTTRLIHYQAGGGGDEGVTNTTELRSALEELPTIGANNFKVECSSLSNICKVEFVGSLAATDVEQMTASGGATVQTREQGGPGGPGILSKRKPDGELLETLDASGHPNALGLDPATGDLYVSDQLPTPPFGQPPAATLLSFDPSGTQLESFATGQVIGHPSDNALAFGDAALRLYVASSASQENSAAQIFTVPPPGPLALEGTSRATELKKTAVTLCSQLNPEGNETTFHYRYLTAKRYEEDGNSFGPGTLETSQSSSIGSDFTAHEACQEVTPLTPATPYRFQILATNTSPGNPVTEGEVARFETQPPAAIDSTSATSVTATSATLDAEINPLGDATAYRFEYLTEAEFQANLANEAPAFFGAAQAPLVPAPIGSGSTDVAVSQHLQGLAPHTVYRYRVVVSNAVSEAHGGPFPGTTLAFTTQATGAFSLPDSRAWEQVSPPDKHGSGLGHSNGTQALQAAAGGDAVTYTASGSTETDPQGFNVEMQVLSGRGSGGWASRDITPPHAESTGFPASPDAIEYPLFSADLSRALLQPLGSFEPLSPEATEQTPYLRTDFAPGNPAGLCAQSCFGPIVNAANTPGGTEFSITGKCPIAVSFGGGCGPRLATATPDFSHLLITSKVALTSTPLSKGATGSYEYSAAAPPAQQLHRIDLLPGEPSSDCSPGSLPGGSPSQIPDESRNRISADGSRVVFGTKEGFGITPHLDLRDTARCETIQLDAVQGGTGTGEVRPRFQFASADGSTVYFTDGQRLTADSGAAGDPSPDLYRCQIVEVAEKLTCELTDLTPSTSGEPANVQGTILGASEDGSSLYFVADGVLTGAERNPRGEAAQPGNCQGDSSAPGHICNLYLLHEGAIKFIAVLAAADHPSWAGGEGAVERLTSRVSPNGRWLAFMSSRPLTGYDNRDAKTGALDQEVFLYDSATGALHCASCDPTGARPQGWQRASANGEVGEEEFLVGLGSHPPGTRLAAVLPGWTTPRYQSRYLSDSGRLFFDAFGPLAPSDSNGTWDVYQYEPPSVGSCTTSSPTYGEAAAGCVSLLSSGTSKEPSAFIDASQSGSDVFFLTSAQLTSTDLDTSLDLYDARAPHTPGEAVGFPEPVKPVECQGDGCQPPAQAPNDPTPGSLTFNGAGNVLECPKGKVKQGGKCVARKHKKHHKKHHKNKAHKRASSNREGQK